MNFAGPLVLLGLLVLPVLAVWWVVDGRRRRRAAAAFVSEPLRASVAPHRPGLRAVIPAILAGLALALFIVAAARPQYRTTVVVKAGSVMLDNDVSASMASTDVSPSRLKAASKAAITFTNQVPASIGVGSLEFASKPTLLQSPSTDHALARQAISQLQGGSGHTAIGSAIETSLSAIKNAPKVGGKTPPGAIVLLSDGTSTTGVPLSTAIADAKRAKVKIYTVAIGTTAGTIQVDGAAKGVPVNPADLKRIANGTGGTFANAPDQASVSAVYSHLATELGHTKVERSLIPFIAGTGLVLLLAGVGLSLFWFGLLA